jgi:hypothetical protein
LSKLEKLSLGKEDATERLELQLLLVEIESPACRCLRVEEYVEIGATGRQFLVVEVKA